MRLFVNIGFLQMMFETMKELFGITHVRDVEEEVPNVKCMHVGKEEVSLSQPITAVVLPVGEVVLVPQGLCQLPPEEEVPPGPPVTVPSNGRGCLVAFDDNGLVPPLVSSSPFFFSQKHRIFFSLFFLINAVDL
jgi:hypothetical protein